MTELGSRVGMTHRCSLLRNAGATNTWGTKDASYTAYLSNVACRAWYVTDTLLVEPAEVTPVATYHIALPLGTDVTVNDRVGPVTFRGALVLAGPSYRIENLVRWPDRIELIVKATGA